jgi:hypothetical protein
MMSEFEKHLYLILFPNEALVGSQLTPEEFRHFHGKVIFAEVDTNYRNEYLELDEYLPRIESSNPGRPKRTKFIKSYRVLEHIDFTALKKLYLVTTDGGVLGLEKSEPANYGEKVAVRLYQEICPLRLLVASNFSPHDFGNYITSGTLSKGAPKIFFTQYDVDVQTVVEHNYVHAYNMGPLPNVNPTNLPTALKEIREDPSKKTKTVSLNPNLDYVSYKLIKHGFWFSEGPKTVYYRMPGIEELHENHYSWWRRL